MSETATTMSKTALITGASRGIGKCIAECFAKNGYHLVLVCRQSMDALLSLKSSLESQYGISIRCFATDVSAPEAVDLMFDTLAKEHVSVDVLINNAGISYVGLIQDMTNEDWDRIISTNLSSCFYTSRGALPDMIANQNGRILNISSVWGDVGASTEVAYSASKGGINAFTKALAKELAPSGIQVNALSCGFIDTQMNGHLSEEEKMSIYESIPAGRAGTASEVAETAYRIITSPSYLTGQVITFDGGWI